MSRRFAQEPRMWSNRELQRHLHPVPSVPLTLDEQLARVAPESFDLAAEMLCIRHGAPGHDHRQGGCLPYPKSYAPAPVKHRFSDDVRESVKTACTSVLMVSSIFAFYGLCAVAGR